MKHLLLATVAAAGIAAAHAGSANATGRKTTVFRSEKMAAFVPMPIASDRMATTA